MVDVHNHYIPDVYWALIEHRVQSRPAFARHARRNNLVPQARQAPMRRLDLRLAEMDEAGVSTAVLSLPPPALSLNDLDERQVRAVNDALVGAAEERPDRFRVFIAAPLPNVALTISEVERLARHPLVVGVAITTNMRDFRLDNPSFELAYRAVADSEAPVFLHPALEPTASAYWQYGLAASIAPVVSSTIGVLHLILSGMLDRIPALRIIVPHLGGLIPFLIQRIEDLSGTGKAQRPVIEYLRERFYFDTCSMHVPALRCAIETVGANRLMLGTDYPFRGSIQRSTDHIHNAGLSAAEVATILSGTALRLLPRG